jgi:hypothetical protein
VSVRRVNRGAQRLLSRIARRRRHQLIDEPGGGTLQHTGRVAARIAHDRPAWRIRRAARHSRHLEGLGVDPGRSGVRRHNLHGPIGNGLIQQLSRRLVGEFRFHPAACANPRVAGIRLGPCGQTPGDGVGGEDVVQIEHLERQPAVDEVEMGIVESGKDGRTLCVDDGRLRAAQAVDFAVAANAQDLVAADGHRLRHRPILVRGVDPRILDDEIDRAVVVALRASHKPGDEGRGDDSNDDVRSKAGRHATSGHGGKPPAPAFAWLRRGRLGWTGHHNTPAEDRLVVVLPVRIAPAHRRSHWKNRQTRRGDLRRTRRDPTC